MEDIFFSVYLGADESSAEHRGHDTWKEHRTEWEQGVRKIHLLQESPLSLGEMNWRTTVTLFCMKRIYKKDRYQMFLVSPEGGTRQNRLNLQQI